MNSITYMAEYMMIFFFPLTDHLFILSRWLKELKKLDVYVEPRVRTELLTESSDFNYVHTWKDGKQCNIVCSWC